jgi:hypothetical protein
LESILSQTVYFTVKEFELAIDNIPPTPIGHIDIENSQNLEIPFAFDEIWEIDGVEWHINEVKIVFLRDVELFVVVVETDLDPLNLPEAEIEEIAKPIAIYSIENGYWDQARQIKIDGKTYPLTEPLAITLINPDNPGQGNRVRFDIDGLMQSP